MALVLMRTCGDHDAVHACFLLFRGELCVREWFTLHSFGLPGFFGAWFVACDVRNTSWEFVELRNHKRCSVEVGGCRAVEGDSDLKEDLKTRQEVRAQKEG